MTDRAKRIQQKERHQKRQTKIREDVFGLDVPNKHRYHKLSGMTCGNKDCVMCGNPRKFFDEKTMQERSFEQTENFGD